MRIALAADHAGFELKDHLAKVLANAGHAVYDFGTHNSDPVDYPDVAATASAVKALPEWKVSRTAASFGVPTSHR